MPEPVDKKTTQQYWQGVLSENLEEVKASLLEAIDATKPGYGIAEGPCPDCGSFRKVRIEYPDTRARTDAVKALHSLAGEIPKDAAGGVQGAGFELRRVLIAPDGAEIELVAEQGELLERKKET